MRISRSAVARCFPSSVSLRSQIARTLSSTSEPFYGSPREPKATTSTCRLGLLIQQAGTALKDPTRADAVAAVGELTGTIALERLLECMKSDSNGRIILQERPIVSKESIQQQLNIARLDEDLDDNPNDSSKNNPTFGQAYGAYLKQHGFDPDERDEVKYIQDPDLAYVMLRYRQCHDYWHVLTGLPPTVLGELGLKWIELFQTGMPMAAFSCTFGSVKLLSYHEQHVLWNIYLPWAAKMAKRLEFGALMMVHYEQEFDTPLVDLQSRLGIEPAPQIVLQGHY
jgi:ubiquinone biosynthesis protein COQ4